MNSISFTVPGIPRGKQRPRAARVGNHVRTYTPSQTVEYENLVKLAYSEIADGFTFGDDAELRVEITAYYSIPKSASKIKRAKMLDGEIRPTKKPDFDNIAKIICDSLNGIAYRDDASIVSARIEKWYSDTPRVIVIISERETAI